MRELASDENRVGKSLGECFRVSGGPEVHIVQAQDGHDYVIVCRGYGDGVAIVHAQGCRACSSAKK